MNIATNIFSKLSSEEVSLIKSFGKDLGVYNVANYVSTSINTEIASFVLHEFNIRKYSRDTKLWDILRALITKLVSIGQKDNDFTYLGVQFWLVDNETIPPINIGFTIVNAEEIETVLSSLKHELETHFSLESKDKVKNKIVSLTYSNDSKEWRLIEL